MKFSCRRRKAGFTLTDAIVATVIVTGMLALLLYWLAQERSRSHRIRCVSYLKQLGIAFRGYGIDMGAYPMQLSVTNRGVVESITNGSVWPIFHALSNQINNPIILQCPADKTKRPTGTFSNLSDSNISYFVGLDSIDTLPNTFLAGDATMMLAGTNLNPGLHVITSNAPLTWADRRHRLQGNILMGDGSVQSLNSSKLEMMVSYTGLATNRLLFP